MNFSKVYDEVGGFIAANNPRGIIAFRPSDESKDRVAGLISREKTEGLSSDEKSELDCRGRFLGGAPATLERLCYRHRNS